MPILLLSKLCQDFCRGAVKMASYGYIRELKKWRVRWRATNRKLHIIFSGSKVFYEKAQAIKFFADIEEQERLWRNSEVAPSESINQALSDYLTYCKRHTSRTQQHYQYVLSKFIESLPKTIYRIQQIEPHYIQEYLHRLRDKGDINRTLNAHLTPIKAFCRYNSDRYDIPNPAMKVKMLKEDPPASRFIEPEEYQKILDVATPLARDRIIFLANTGLRATEFSKLSAKDINLEMNTITIVGKGRKQRTIPLNETACQVLPKLKLGTRNALWLSFSRLAQKAGVPKFGPHSLRHYFATQLLRKGVPVIVVSRLLGHKSIRTTEQIYAHILTADLADATKVLDC